MGENGAGKTTIVKLLSRLYDPVEGRITVDGIDLRAFDLDDLRGRIALILQDFVRYSLHGGREHRGRPHRRRGRPRAVEDAAARALADRVIDRLPQGYDQPLGRRFKDGVELSGGEWQKMAIARAYMRDGAVLVLDEPTAALDARAEYEVFRRFRDLSLGRTCLIISHRFSTVRMADRIVVLEDGRVQERAPTPSSSPPAAATPRCSNCRPPAIVEARPAARGSRDAPGPRRPPPDGVGRPSMAGSGFAAPEGRGNAKPAARVASGLRRCRDGGPMPQERHGD